LKELSSVVKEVGAARRVWADTRVPQSASGPAGGGQVHPKPRPHRRMRWIGAIPAIAMAAA